MFVDGTRPVPPGGAVEQVLQELRGKGYRIQPYDDRADLWVGVYAFSFDSSPGKGELVVEIQERYTHRRVWLGWIVLAPAGARRESGAFPVRTEDVKELLQSLPVL
jgi:hypothetical protein